MALYQKRQELFRNATGAEGMLNLIWADIAANSTVGTRGWLSTPLPNMSKRDLNSTSQAAAEVPSLPVVSSYKIPYCLRYPRDSSRLRSDSRCRCHLCAPCTSRTGTERMSRYLALTSSGRIFGTFLYPSLSDPLAPTKAWIKQVGVQGVTIVSGSGRTAAQGDFRNTPLYHRVPLTEVADAAQTKA